MTYDLAKVTANQPEAEKQFNNNSSMGKLSDLYQMRIRLCDKKGVELSGNQVVATVIDAEMTLESQYSNPFENMTPEHKLPTLMGMLQSGDGADIAETALSNVFGVQLSENTKESLNNFVGRSSLTKINSTQIFLSSQPVTIPATLLFSAWENAKVEVEDQIKLLQQWSLPQELVESLIKEVTENKSLKSIFPSTAPPYVAVYYGGKRYFPMLISSCSAPLSAPMDNEGNRMQLQVQVTFLSRTAWDAANINQLYTGV